MIGENDGIRSEEEASPPFILRLQILAADSRLAFVRNKKAPPVPAAGHKRQYSDGKRIVLLVYQSVMPSSGKSVYSICLE